MGLLQLSGRTLVTRSLTRYTVPSETSGTLASGQAFTMKKPTSGPSAYPGVIFFPGAFGDADQIVTDSDLDRITDDICSLGFNVICGDLGGTQRWGNPTGRTYIDELAAKLVTEGSHATKVILAGISGGCVDALSWASVNLTRVLGFAGIAPASSLQQLYDDDPLGIGITASITAAHGGPPPYPLYDPTLLAEAGLLDGLKYRAWYGSTDSVVTPETVEGVADAIGATAWLVDYAVNHFFVAAQVPSLQPSGGTGYDVFASWVAMLWPTTRTNRAFLKF